MSKTVPPAAQASSSTRADITNEVRYAVVMYGGVSLCIYINGVAQELLEMARATSPGDGEMAFATKDLSASAKIYRRLGQYLDSDSMDLGLLAGDNETASIRTRFVIDVLSGTSAGGLNAIFLAKALVNNKSMDGLKRLWMEEGDIDLLLNDKRSSLPGLPAKGAPESLLNSQRMYAQLLKALHVMDFPSDPNLQCTAESAARAEASKPLVDALDLYVTATDLAGLPIHLKLENTVADEFRHRNVFRFRFGAGPSDFTWQFNPLLAFVGRCTSSIPPAFEPMRLEDIRPVLRIREPYRAMAETGLPDWNRAFSDYLKTEETGDFWQRDFGDGGFLDNKPFTYATRTLMQRQAALPVRRKLIFVEPSPETLGPNTALRGSKPDAIAHSLAALIELPRYETIREDIEAVLDRNRLLENIDEVTRDVERDVVTFSSKVIEREEGERFERITLDQMIGKYGLAYGVYHRLKVAEVTSDLAGLVSDLLEYPEGADECFAIRKLVESWRNRFYDENPPRNSKLKTESAFLMDFDPGYRLRRLYFLHRKISFFYRFAPGSPQKKERDTLRHQGYPDPLPPEIAIFLDDPDPSSWVRFRQALLEIKPKLAGALAELRRVGREVRQDPGLAEILKEMKVDKRSLGLCLSDEKFALDFVQQHAPLFKTAADRLASIYEKAFVQASVTCTEILKETAKLGVEQKIARKILRGFYECFDHYDMALFPVQYGKGSSETPHIDVLRVSPDDAKNLCDDTVGKRRKLAGRMYFSFGAFFADFWRENDMLWGRLDGAEILVRDLLRKTPAETTRAIDDPAFQRARKLKPDDARTVAEVMVDDLHRAILTDHLSPKRREDVWTMLQKALPHLNRENLHKEIDDFLNDSPGMKQSMRNIINFCKDDDALLSYYKNSYEVHRQIEPKVLLRLAARTSQIFGKMLDGISLKRGNDKSQRSMAMVIRAATIFSGLVELSVPRTAGALLWRYWRALLYAIGLVLFLVGLLFGKGPVQTGGLLILTVTALVHLATAWLELFIGRWRWLNRITVTVVSLAIALLLVLGIWKAWELPGLVWERWTKITQSHPTDSREQSKRASP